MQLAELAHIVQAELKSAVDSQIEFSGVAIDTRRLHAGNLYIAYAGPKHNGHDFVSEAARLGASAALVSQWVDVDLPQIKVPDTLVALQRYAAWHRSQFQPTVIAITGSCGKTTTRSLLQSILSVNHSVLATEGNYNNHIGVPLMLLRLHAAHQFAVFELGANHMGEIAHLAELVQPDVALITQAGFAHIEGFGSLQNVAQAKGEIYAALPVSGCAVINVADDFASYWKSVSCANKQVTFSSESLAQVTATDVVVEDQLSFNLHIHEKSVRVSLSMLGEHNVNNALAAAAAAHAVGIDLDVIRQGLESAANVRGRMCSVPGASGALIIDDAYNANPSSMRAAIDALRSIPKYKRRVLVFGDMLELGVGAEEFHREVAQYARQQGIDLLFTFGQLASVCADAFGDGGLHCSSHEDLLEQLNRTLDKDSVVLIKGSNSLGLQRVADALI
jgi:UDP-N-acetylmuramoyl-tripeptide--D-alanyl-D-alanine ligase